MEACNESRADTSNLGGFLRPQQTSHVDVNYNRNAADSAEIWMGVDRGFAYCLRRGDTRRKSAKNLRFALVKRISKIIYTDLSKFILSWAFNSAI